MNPVLNLAQMVDRVKDGQRWDMMFKEKWGAFCDHWFNGIRDPSKHPEANLTWFLQQMEGSRAGSLVDQIKDGQRNDADFKDRWVHFCDQHFNGVRDPVS